ncbi:MAG TPA: hypothetical protein DDZ81_12430 [Acetobacteraceae bacterium]|jgi:phospholipase/lecithinase/hemolysin|nr:hypothetical protein [Acetobacteraceae bacterium]
MATFKSLTDPFDTMAGLTPDQLGITAAPAFLASDAVTVPPGGFSALYAFGDSLSDAGNIAYLTRGLEPAAPYNGGRFTSGDVWVQDLARDLGLPPVKNSLQRGTDYAYGGAETGANPQHTALPTDLPSQLLQFEFNTPLPNPNALYTVWAGANDILGLADSNLTPAQQQAGAQQAANNEVSMIKGLISHGAKNLVVLGVPDLSKTPSGLAAPNTAATKAALAQDFNADLGAGLREIMAAGTAKIDYIDTFGLLDAVIANPAPFGFTDVTQPLWTGNYTDPNSGGLRAVGTAQAGYLFFDGLHPTAQTHFLLAASVTQTLTATA